MKTPTSKAPHICDHVLFQISASCLPLMRSSSATMIHEARMAEPPTNGVHLKPASIVAPCVIDEAAVTFSARGAMLGSFDQGPVQATTTMTRTAIGIQACRISLRERPCPAVSEEAVTG